MKTIKTIKANLILFLLLGILTLVAVFLLAINSQITTAASSCFFCRQDVYDVYCGTVPYGSPAGLCPKASNTATIYAGSCADAKCASGGSGTEYMNQDAAGTTIAAPTEYVNCPTLYDPPVSIAGCTRSQCVSNTIPTSIAASTTQSVNVVMQNPAWSVPWINKPDGTSFKLGSQNQLDNTVWGSNRVYTPLDLNVPAGSSYTFTFNITAPGISGIYDGSTSTKSTSRWKTIQEGPTGVGWFGSTCGPTSISVGPANPTVLTATCAVSATSVTFSWTASPAASYYTLRVNDDTSDTTWTPGISGDIEQNISSPATVAITAGHTYDASVQAYNSYGSSNKAWFNWSGCTVAASPTNPTLQVNNASSTQVTGGFTSTSRISGLQSSQGGHNWFNPIKITASATRGTAVITKYYVAFYDKTGGLIPASSSFLSTIQGRLNSQRNAGFLLAYGNGIKSGEVNQYYVWDPASNNWVNITGVAQGYNICSTGTSCTAQTLLYTAFAGNPAAGNPSLANTWQILFDKNYDSKSMYTAVYVVDNNNLSAFVPDIIPTP